MFLSPKVTVHVTTHAKAADVYEAHAGRPLLTPPFGGPERMMVCPESVFLNTVWNDCVMIF